MNKYPHIYTVSAADMDNRYRITPHAILLYFQDSFARYMSCLHLAAFDLVKVQKMWIITEFSAQMSEIETFWTEDIEVTLWISEISALRVYSDYIIKKADTEVVIAKGTSCWCLMNTETRRLEITDSVAAKITILPDIVLSHKKIRFPKPEKSLKNIEHKVNLLDLDFNRHVNNRSYLSIAMLTADDKFLSDNYLHYMVIHWLHETYLDETLKSELAAVDKNIFLNSIVKEDGTTAAEIYSEWRKIENPVDISEVLVRK